MNAYLLDTHAFLWWAKDERLLPDLPRSVIANAGNRIFVSLASAWEIAIKISIGKLLDPGAIPEILERAKFTPLEIAFDHIEQCKSLPLYHRDPFDRMLIAQAMAEDLTLVSNETVFDAYGVARVWG
jgi:PIN domain nuclease of toxin-antitoxin system